MAAKQLKRIVEIDRALEIFHAHQGYQPDEKKRLSRKTIYNDIWKKRLVNYGSKPAFVDADEVIALHGKRLSAQEN
jgi:hypothetical protein